MQRYPAVKTPPATVELTLPDRAAWLIAALAVAVTLAFGAMVTIAL